MTRIAVVDNSKLKYMEEKKHIQGLCPVNRAGKECIYFEGPKLMIDEALCIGCGICANTAPDAIHIINLPEELKKEPIHRFGKNAFALYSLPTPTFGKVVGILGRNGIGKSTAIKILAGVLKPNLGNTGGKEAGYDEMIEFFKGTEAQGFFEKLKKGEIKVGYKPQNVDTIPRTAKGRVRDLLKKVDEKNEMEKIAGMLDLNEVLDNDITKVSGGELQRIAIAATVLKKANFYVFDEPTSYLDIKQRIKVSAFIRNLADEKTAVMVVEHDLIILDYMADLVHIMYGKEGCYGIVGLPKTTRVGINVYLSGYLKEENIRFRDKEIKFFTKLPIDIKKTMEVVGWSQIEKKLGKFHLKAEPGRIYRHEVVGVLGENGIGKTSFVKILADVEKPDKGELNGKVSVSYKPQYLDANDELVMSVLADAMQSHSKDLINPLNIKPLMEQQLDQLSGGELQRVAIALCLSKDADVFLLDEPSAYLDVEQRLLVSRVIRDIMEKTGKSAIIVDHDLLFIDYLSDELMVFDGKPAINGTAKGPFKMAEGMNMFLRDLNITYRRDPESLRPRVNKPDSQKDREQKREGKLYYS